MSLYWILRIVENLSSIRIEAKLIFVLWWLHLFMSPHSKKDRFIEIMDYYINVLYVTL